MFMVFFWVKIYMLWLVTRIFQQHMRNTNSQLPGFTQGRLVPESKQNYFDLYFYNYLHKKKQFIIYAHLFSLTDYAFKKGFSKMPIRSFFTTITQCMKNLPNLPNFPSKGGMLFSLVQFRESIFIKRNQTPLFVIIKRIEFDVYHNKCASFTNYFNKFGLSIVHFLVYFFLFSELVSLYSVFLKFGLLRFVKKKKFKT